MLINYNRPIYYTRMSNRVRSPLIENSFLINIFLKFYFGFGRLGIVFIESHINIVIMRYFSAYLLVFGEKKTLYLFTCFLKIR